MLESAEKLTPRQRSILEAALRRFSHYGLRRTSMDDLAREAELSRTALYQHFANKEEIFRMLAVHLYHQALSTARGAALADGPLRVRILGVLEAKQAFFYELLMGSEHGLEILGEGNRLCGDVTADANKRYLRLLAGVIRDGETRGDLALRDVGLNPSSAARFFVSCAEGLWGGPGPQPTPQVYRQRLRQLVDALVIGFGPGATVRGRRSR